MRAVAIALVRPDPWRRDGPAPVIDHRRFGPMRASFRPESDAFTWECLDLLPTPRGAVDIELEAGAWGPVTAHEQQLGEIVANLDELTRAAAPLIASTFGEVSALEWQGALLTGRSGSFRLHYWCTTASELLVTVSFEQSQARWAEMHE